MKNLDQNKLIELSQFIKTYQMKNGKSPTHRTMIKEMNFSGFASLQRYLKKLVSNGLVIKNDIGGIDIPENLRLDETVKVPVVGEIACGNPILAIENIEAVVDLPVVIFGKGDFRIYHAKGDSMTGVGIHDGDLIVARPSDIAENGDIVIAIVEDSATVKTYYKKGNKIILHPENPNYEDIIVDNCIIQGIVKKSIHNL